MCQIYPWQRDRDQPGRAGYGGVARLVGSAWTPRAGHPIVSMRGKVWGPARTLRIETFKARPLSRVGLMLLSLFLGGLLLRWLFVGEAVVECDGLRRDGIIRTIVKRGEGRRGSALFIKRDREVGRDPLAGGWEVAH
jgi:hypothetical protein